MSCENNKQQLSVGHRDAHMQYQTYSSFVIRLRCFSDVNIDVFDTRASIKWLFKTFILHVFLFHYNHKTS